MKPFLFLKLKSNVYKNENLKPYENGSYSSKKISNTK